MRGAEGDHVRVAPPPAGGFWWRLVKASALVAVGIAVNLWVDSARRRVSDDAVTTAAGVSVDRSRTSGDVRGTSGALFVAPARADASPAEPLVESPRRVTNVAAGREDAPLADADRRRTAVFSSPPGVLRVGGFPDLPGAELPAMPLERRLAGWLGDVADLTPVAVPELTVAESRGPVTAESSPAISSATRSVRTMAAATTPREEESILQVLRDYETALGRKDPLAAKALWPALDDRALARAFNGLQSQSLALEGCGVTFASSNAAARAKCQGVATYLPKVGRRKPISASHEWTFKLAKAGGDWQIESAAIR